MSQHIKEKLNSMLEHIGKGKDNAKSQSNGSRIGMDKQELK